MHTFFPPPSSPSGLISFTEGFQGFFKALIPYLKSVIFLDNAHPSHLAGQPDQARKGDPG